MKVVILAGGKGTRFAEETHARPKPMIEIGGKPILWHIMKHFNAHGCRDFNVALGYKGDFIKLWFVDHQLLRGGFGVKESAGVSFPPEEDEDWNVNLVDTGLETQTGGRIKAVGKTLGNEPFLLTWGDGVSDLNVQELIQFHRQHGKLATMVVAHPPARFGHVVMDGDLITNFEEKPKHREGWINAGIFVLEPQVLSYIGGPETEFERGPLDTLAKHGQLMAYRHEGFWQCMDTIHDRKVLEELWAKGSAPWTSWEQNQSAPSLRVISGM